MERGDKKEGFLAKIKKNPDLKEEYEKKIAFWEQFGSQVTVNAFFWVEIKMVGGW